MSPGSSRSTLEAKTSAVSSVALTLSALWSWWERLVTEVGTVTVVS